ncbi:MAG: DUF192 domain-containing protein [Endomicrobium sp.]|jgi:uncharacterized membrane protein (UPF0127 family)|nr:DUF192 domain-containing protein [Endomicrobium sp.]
MGNTKLGIPIIKAETFWERFSGFMFKKSANYALLFNNCKSIHTCFMRFDVDVVYLDKSNRVLKVIKSLQPFKVAFLVKNSASILEIPSNMTNAEELAIGKKIDCLF